LVFSFLLHVFSYWRICVIISEILGLSSTKTGSYPHEFLCRTNCSACADYQPW
jgi:hypothetical protein